MIIQVLAVGKEFNVLVNAINYATFRHTMNNPDDKLVHLVKMFSLMFTVYMILTMTLTRITANGSDNDSDNGYDNDSYNDYCLS